MKFLYNRGFQTLGHAHSGNIFVAIENDMEVCQVGGYEMTLLGYRTTLYRSIKEKKLLKYIDIITFGRSYLSATPSPPSHSQENYHLW